MSVLEIKNLTKNYGSKQALKDVSFTAEKGEVIGLLILTAKNFPNS